jgi:hypothetical protein
MTLFKYPSHKHAIILEFVETQSIEIIGDPYSSEGVEYYECSTDNLESLLFDARAKFTDESQLKQFLFDLTTGLV